ncbi:hypothetical protein J4727_11790 [Providencia rettgeri]|uniref:Uncharacterized protein n=1 Tax=Providencia rettgeri TaxID=587 RepID=A0A939SRE7_PRORE|nr:hypothetical protein [Providencia rettgeri]
MSLEAFYTLIALFIYRCNIDVEQYLQWYLVSHLLSRYLNKIFFCAIVTVLTTFGWMLAAGLMGDGWAR